MVNSWTIVTAMPPTVGHDALIEFTSWMGSKFHVVMNTQPHEPDVRNRVNAVRLSTNRRRGAFHHYGQTIEQNPEAPGFRQMWADLMRWHGFQPGDRLVTSETYGSWLAEMLGGEWVPYDLHRSLMPSKASHLRLHAHNVFYYWNRLMPEYRDIHQKRVTIFGAESVGKTTTAHNLTAELGENAKFLPEWARPYLESVGPEVTNKKMHTIFDGQSTVQRMFTARQDNQLPKPALLVQDTDLYSTIGYWRMYDNDYFESLTVGNQYLLDEAMYFASDLYVVCPSDIPFEPDQLRYGGDKRESTDQYWIDLLEEFDLPYVVWDRDLDSLTERVLDLFPDLRFEREHNGH